jgi:hypothetical protein
MFNFVYKKKTAFQLSPDLNKTNKDYSRGVICEEKFYKQNFIN